jgi:hypothetical protein
MLAIPAAPIIAPGGASGIEDRRVERIIGQWLGALQVEAQSQRAALDDFLDLRTGHIGGNPKAQARWLARVKRKFGDRLLCADVRTGNRARYHVTLDFMVPMAIHRSDVDRDESPDWLAGVRASVSRAGANAKSSGDAKFIGALSRHCVKRLIQRCGCESATDLHLAFRTAWPTISKLEAATREVRAMRNGDVWRIAVNLPTMAEPAIFVMAGPSPADDAKMFFAKTCYPISYLNARERAEVAALHQSLEIAPSGASRN